MVISVTIPESELFDEVNNEFIKLKGITLQLEHSLIAISKWEASTGKAFLGAKEKTSEETLDYVRCMTITQNIAPEVYNRISPQQLKEINAYINSSMSATKIGSSKESTFMSETVTSELIYYWMFSLGIPLDCQKWHLNRLLTLIRVFSIKNNPPKKMSQKQLMARNRALNESRRKAIGTSG